MSPDSAFVADLTWDAVADRLADGAAAILPIGAGSKQHGLHLPLGTDAVQAGAYAVEAARQSGGLIWPTLNYGAYPSFTAYAGSVSLTPATVERLVREIVDDLLRQTRAFVLVIDTGLSTVAPVARALASCAEPARAWHWAVYQGAEFQRARHAVQTQAYGSHADEIETSLMLALAPDRVVMARAAASPSAADVDAPGRLEPGDPTTPLYAPSGSWGDPTRATVETGEQLLAAIYRDLAGMLQRARSSCIQR